MLRITVSPSVAAAKSYYTGGLSKGDYYAENEESQGIWLGKGASQLGLKTAVENKAFNSLCENLNPRTGEQLTPRNKANRRVGYDVNFHAPKSLSLLYSVTKDKDILHAFQSAVRDTMTLLEKDVQTRVRVGREMTDRVTGNLCWAEFTHYTARPVDGHPDPHLHCHCFVFNATYDQDERRWKALQFGSVKRDAYYYEAAFHNQLCRNLRELGYDMDRKGKFWELTGFSDSLLKRFSRRGKEVEALAKELGIENNDKLKDGLAAKTREAKRTDLSKEALQELWESALTGEELSWLKAHRSRTQTQSKSLDGVAKEVIAFAADHNFERHSTTPERRLLDTALRQSLGRTTLEEATTALRTSSLMKAERSDGTRLYSRDDVMHEERYMLSFARNGKQKCEPFNRDAARATADTKLNNSQKRAARHVLRSADRVTLLRGGAGTGKTHTMKFVVNGIEQNGYKVTVLAPTAEASRDVLRREGFAEAETLSKFLVDAKLQTKARGQVIWVDEAGLIGAKAMSELFRTADKLGARVVLGGDYRQHKSVERGNAFEQLVTKAGLQTTELSEVVRQRGEYRNVAANLSAGRMDEAWKGLEEMKAVEEGKQHDIYKLAAQDYAQSVKGGKSCLLISPTHAERNAVTSHVRSILKEYGTISGKACQVYQLVPTNWTDAERRDPTRYKSEGQILQFYRSYGRWKAGDRVEVIGASQHGVRVQDGRSYDLTVPFAVADKFGVFEESSIEVAKGDKIRVTSNAKSQDGKHKITNSSLHDVKSVGRDGTIKLKSGLSLPPTFGHIDHGYAVTSHKAQGKTVDQVVIVQTALSHAATSAEQFYVSITRGRDSVKIYTDNKKDLKEMTLKGTNRITWMDAFEPSAEPDTTSQKTLEQKAPEVAAQEQHRRRQQNEQQLER